MADHPITTFVQVSTTFDWSAEAEGLAVSAFSRMTSGIDTMLTDVVTIVFKTPSQMVAGGDTLTDGSAAWGYTHSTSREVHINTSPNGVHLASEKIQYTILHEAGGHMSDHDVMTAAKRATIAGLMTPVVNTGVAGYWGTGISGQGAAYAYKTQPNENYADTFPRAWAGITSVLAGYYLRPIASADYGTYRTTITGVGAPSATTLAATANAGVSNIKVVSVTGFAVGDWMAVGSSSSPEQLLITSVGTAGAGGTGISFSPVTTVSHGSGAPVVGIDGPTGGGGLGGDNPTYSITIGGLDYTGRIPAASISVSESGSDAVATMEFVVETMAGQIRLGGSGDETAQEVIFTELGAGRRLFAGHLVGATRRHLAGPGIAQEIRCVSYDAWLDRRYLANYWTTDTNTQTGNKLADDRLIVQDIIQKGKVGGGLAISLAAPNSTIASTNTAMPKMNLGDGSIRDHILQVAEQAATIGDPAIRRVYVDFFATVHYFEGSEGNVAPYRVGDASYTTTVKATAGLYALWSLAEASGATSYDTINTKNLTLSGAYARGVTGGVVNEPQNRAVNFAGAGGAVATSASFNTNVFSLEMWFQRGLVGAEQTLADTGAAGYTLEFDSTDHLRLYKRGTGTDFITTGTFTDTLWHHLVVTHNGSATHIYVDGTDKNGTATLKTFAPPANDLYFAKLSDGTLKFNGALQDVAFYTSVIVQATVTAHYNDGVAIVPDDIGHDIDFNDSAVSAYVQGTGISGWVNSLVSNSYGANTLIDRADVDTIAKRDAVGRAYLQRDGAPIKLIRLTVTGFDGWRAGQTVTIDDAGLGISGSYEFRDIQMTPSMAGSTSFTYEISCGAMPWRGHYDIKRKRRNSVGGAQIA